MTSPIEHNPCCEPAWQGLCIDWRTGYLFAKICPHCDGATPAEQEARRLRYNVISITCPQHTAEAIDALTGESGREELCETPHTLFLA